MLYFNKIYILENTIQGDLTIYQSTIKSRRKLPKFLKKSEDKIRFWQLLELHLMFQHRQPRLHYVRFYNKTMTMF